MTLITARTNIILLSIAIGSITLFLLAINFKMAPGKRFSLTLNEQVVISAPIQILMYSGDRFLAAEIEALRVMAVGPSEERALAPYRVRAYSVVSQLNPCHEDNVYLSNAMLSWGGSIDEGNVILERATECRTWDEMPPFLLGFNRYFFKRDFERASQAIELAASRSKDNSAALKKLSIMINAKALNDEKLAAAYLRSQRDQEKDPRLVKMLDDRLTRLEGLFTLREAQKKFELQFKRKLTDPNELFSSRMLDSVPVDPLGLGYEFRNGEFVLKQIRIAGMETN